MRITPAYAGKSPPAKRRNPAIWDHPRVCGEKPVTTRFASSFWGSPPRVRGKVTEILDYLDGLRITPAYAGKSRAGQATQVRVRDHPRVCGEKQGVPAVAGRNLGSPPRMRGKVLPLLHSPHPPGITPACAGKSYHLSGTGFCGRDHPRVCGEKMDSLPHRALYLGSPPRMRGKAVCNADSLRTGGITPAYAGKSDATRWTITIRRDHPRVCGEKTLCRSTVVPVWGSPPRVRGKAVPLRSAAASGCRGPSVPEYDAPP